MKLNPIILIAAAAIVAILFGVSLFASGVGVNMPDTNELNTKAHIQPSVCMFKRDTGLEIFEVSGDSPPPAAKPNQIGTVIHTVSADFHMVAKLVAPDGSQVTTESALTMEEVRLNTVRSTDMRYYGTWYDIGTPIGVSQSGTYSLTISFQSLVGGVMTALPQQFTVSVVVP